MKLIDLKQLYSKSKTQVFEILQTLTPREEIATMKFLENISLNSYELIILNKVEHKINHPSRLGLLEKIK